MKTLTFPNQSRPSSMLKSVKYDEQNQRLVATFANGQSVQYEGVPANIVDELDSAESAGSAFSKLIKGGGYDFEYI